MLSEQSNARDNLKSLNARPNQTQERPVGVGVVGCGNVMDGAYMPVIDKLIHKGWVRLVGVSHTRRERCQAVLDKWDIRNYFDSYHELCHSPEIDLVVILTSTNEHAAIAREALRAGKHVMLEKPMATRLEDAADLLRLANDSLRYFVCAPFVTLSPTFQIIRDRVRAGDIGKVCLARGRYGWSGPDWADWFYRAGGGPIFDLAVYCITSLTGILGPARRVMAMTGVAQPGREIKGKEFKVQVEDNAQILLDFGEANFAVITSGFTMQKYRSPALELYGTSGTVQMLGDDWGPEGYEIWQNSAGCWQTYYETDPHWQWTEGLRHIVECIRTGETPSVTPEHAYHVLEIMLAAQKSGRSGCAEQIVSTFETHTGKPRHVEAEAAHRVHDRRREA